MKKKIETVKPSGIGDVLALALTTVGVGYIPGAPGTWGSMVAVIAYLCIALGEAHLGLFGLSRHFNLDQVQAIIWAVNAVALTAFCLIGIKASSRSIPLLGNSDPSEAVVDEVMGQLITFCFVPFGLSWPFILAGFLLFRLFDIWKPYPIDDLQSLEGGLGVCADDIVAGVYAGICLAVGYGLTLLI